MAITQNDLEILKSEIMADTPDGGGLPTGIAVIDGVSNNLFPDVSDIDRLIGRVRLRKVSLAVKTANADLLQATRMLFTELPANPNISVFAFKATSFADRRVDAQNKIESYLAFGTKWAGHLLETQLAGQRVIQISLDKGDAIPAIDKPLVLIQNEGQSDEFYQYIRPTKVDTVERRFQVTLDKTVTRIIVTIEFGDTLTKTFTGLTVPEFYNSISTSRRAILREARVADAAKYYSASRLAEPVIAMQSRQVVVNSIYTQVVPSTQVETPLLQVDPVNQGTSQAVGTNTILINKTISATANTSFNLTSGVAMGSLTLTVADITLTDTKGELRTALGVSYGAINYGTGQVTWYSNMNKGQVAVTGSYKPASDITRVAQTDYQIVGGNAGYNYVRELGTEPLAGSLKVSYVVQGSVYNVTDDGHGNLVDLSGNGRGTVTGRTVLLTTAAIPDTDSYIIYSFGVDLDTTKIADKVLSPAYHIITIPDGMPASITVTWGVGKTATVTNGVITGDATGSLSGNRLLLAPNITVDKGTEFTLSYSRPLPASALSYSDTQAGRVLSFNMGGAITKGQVRLDINTSQGLFLNVVLSTVANSNALVVSSVSKSNYDIPVNAGEVDPRLSFVIESSNVDKLTGKIDLTFSVKITTKFTYIVHRSFFRSDYTKTVYKNNYPVITSTGINAVAVKDDLVETINSTVIVQDMLASLITGQSQSLLAGSVFLNAMGASINDKNGVLYSGDVAVGSVDYGAGLATLTNWTAAAINKVTATSLVVQEAPLPVANIIFRTPSAPLKEASFQMNVTLDNGTVMSLSTDAQGGITGSAYAHGQVDFKSGVIALYFYEKLKVADNPTVINEPWYAATNIYAEGGFDYINRPIDVKPDSIRYNAVAYSYLPLDKELIGLDPVRLPTDGRVPFVRKGDSIAITELKTMVLPTNAPNDTFNLGFTRLSDVNVVDSTGKKVSFDYLDIDLDAGVLTLNALFDMTLYTAPLTAKFRIMDIALVIETDISGRVTLSTVITHNYSTAAVFSSMLLAGDMQSRAYGVFSQKSWGSVFSDTLLGDAATSQLQVTNNPIVVTNRDAIEERWALVFTGSTSFRIIGQTVGEIGVGSTGTVTSPLNPMTLQPYFTIPVEAWGSGWAANNVVRFNTVAAKYPVWIGNAIQQHTGSSADNYDFTIGYHANIDRNRG
ncbi:hypothetical protein [Psychrobacter arcticus]|nr:hypothetical protein [Psychrobacter arcticus]